MTKKGRKPITHEKRALIDRLSGYKSCFKVLSNQLNHYLPRLYRKKYPLAFIEVCECNLARFPQVEEFVKSNMVKKWQACVKVRHVRGTLPTIKLLDAQAAEVKKIMNIEKWDTDAITEFLNTWLEC
ncbi:unnamed protein product [Thelazia callipaeda]|uniref:Selenoprotein F n=1 Tax=Thelazia callipaeda TaxID=103827 RepID=A0A0N5D0L3_THECL|nr:unnamed protein product [Thelazia callipaeda]